MDTSSLHTRSAKGASVREVSANLRNEFGQVGTNLITKPFGVAAETSLMSRGDVQTR
jgi:hypothetical protein